MKWNGDIDADWQEIVKILGLDIHYDTLRKMSYGYRRMEEYLHGFEGVATTILGISDLHFPFQLPIETFKDCCGKIDVLVLNGDILDMQSISSFSKSYRISPIMEMVGVRAYIIELIRYIGAPKVYFTYGNHEQRFSTYLAKNLDCEIRELMPETALDYLIDDGFYHYDKSAKTKTWYEPIKSVFDDVEIIYERDWKCRVGKTLFAHPFAFSSAPLKTCEKAMDYFHRTEREQFDTVVLAHTHRVGMEKKGFVSLYEQGACCQTSKMTYTDGRLSDPQKEGFVIICQDSNGNNITSKSKLQYLN